MVVVQTSSRNRDDSDGKSQTIQEHGIASFLGQISNHVVHYKTIKDTLC
jgi:hypothetical protein